MKLRKTALVLAVFLSSVGVLAPQPLNVQAASGNSVNVSYQTHVQNVGWQEVVKNGATSGTVGKALRLEGIKINVSGADNLSVSYKTHVQQLGWEVKDASNGGMSGTEGRGLRLEAISMKLAGSNASNYDIYYRVHCQDYGWMDWAKNGEYSGTEGQSKRLEGIEIKVVTKGSAAPGSTAKPFVGNSFPSADGFSNKNIRSGFIKIDGEVYQFPMVYGDFIKNDWVPTPLSPLPKELKPGETIENITLSKKNSIIYLDVVNHGNKSVPINDLSVFMLNISMLIPEQQISVELPKGIHLSNSTLTDLRSAYGNTDFDFASSSTAYHEYGSDAFGYQIGEDASIFFYIYGKDNHKFRFLSLSSKPERINK